MSWDVFIKKFDKQYKSVQDTPNNAKPLVLGKRSEIQNAISKHFRGTDWTDPAWGIWSSKYGSIEFDISADEEIVDITLHVRAKTPVVPMIIKLVRQNGWQAIDSSSSVFLEQVNRPKVGLKKWLKFRKSIIKKFHSNGSLIFVFPGDNEQSQQ